MLLTSLSKRCRVMVTAGVHGWLTRDRDVAEANRNYLRQVVDKIPTRLRDKFLSVLEWARIRDILGDTGLSQIIRTRSIWKTNMHKHSCGWAGCSNHAEARLDRRPLCQVHFYDIASKRVGEYRARLSKGDPAGADRTRILSFVSEVISETTTLVASATFLGQEQREKYLELSLSTAKLYKRVQRHPRISRNMPILISHEADSAARQELTNTINVSKQGACIATKGKWKTGEKIWVQRPRSALRALAWVTWVKETEPSQFLIGIEILDCEDLWKLELAALRKIPLTRPRGSPKRDK